MVTKKTEFKTRDQEQRNERDHQNILLLHHQILHLLLLMIQNQIPVPAMTRSIINEKEQNNKLCNFKSLRDLFLCKFYLFREFNIRASIESKW